MADASLHTCSALSLWYFGGVTSVWAESVCTTETAATRWAAVMSYFKGSSLGTPLWWGGHQCYNRVFGTSGPAPRLQVLHQLSRLSLSWGFDAVLGAKRPSQWQNFAEALLGLSRWSHAYTPSLGPTDKWLGFKPIWRKRHGTLLLSTYTTIPTQVCLQYDLAWFIRDSLWKTGILKT